MRTIYTAATLKKLREDAGLSVDQLAWKVARFHTETSLAQWKATILEIEDYCIPDALSGLNKQLEQPLRYLRALGVEPGPLDDAEELIWLRAWRDEAFLRMSRNETQSEEGFGVTEAFSLDNFANEALRKHREAE